jgi:hypothetical protein
MYVVIPAEFLSWNPATVCHAERSEASLRFFVEPVLSKTTRFFASLRMTEGEGLRMTDKTLDSC